MACLLVSVPALAGEGRYFLEGDGTLKITNSKTGQGGTIPYRTSDGNYQQEAVNRLFGVATGSSESISMRLIALMDYLQEELAGGKISIVSGYRSPQYNQNLRKKGRLAAPTSLHMEGMAADINMDNVDGEKLWKHVRELNCCGAGYYHGKGIHVDTGPSRFWDETSTKVDQDLGGHNKLVLLRTDYDRYKPGDTVRMTLSRITDYPIGIRPQAHLIKDGRRWKEMDLAGLNKNCATITDRRAAKNLSWTIPSDLSSSENIQIELEFCNKPYPEMPDRTSSNPVSIEPSR